MKMLFDDAEVDNTMMMQSDKEIEEEEDGRWWKGR